MVIVNVVDDLAANPLNHPIAPGVGIAPGEFHRGEVALTEIAADIQ
jgi:hypothetical protein